MRWTLIVLVLSMLLQVCLSTEKLLFWLDYDYIPRAKAFFKVHHRSGSWLDAVKGCALEGATLVNPRNIAELKDTLPFMSDTEKYWIGFQYLEPSHRHHFSPFQKAHYFLNWRIGNPVDDIDAPKYCVSTDVSGKFVNTDCEEPLHSICKKDAGLPNSDDDIHFDIVQPFTGGYIYSHKTNFYYKSHEPSTWHRAMKTCASEGAVLAAPQDELELHEIIEHKHPKSSAVWIGAHGIINKEVIQQLDQESGDDQTIILDEDYSGEENCLEASPSGEYIVRDCGHLNGFVCKKIIIDNVKPNENSDISGSLTIKKKLMDFSNVHDNHVPITNVYDSHYTPVVLQHSIPKIQQRFLDFKGISANQNYNNQGPQTTRYVRRSLDNVQPLKPAKSVKKLHFSVGGSFTKKYPPREEPANLYVDQD